MAKNNNLGDFLTDIANAIRTKKGTSGTIPAQDFSSEILSIQGGGGGMTYEDYARTLYLAWGQSRIFSNDWQDSQNSKTVLYDIPLTLEEEIEVTYVYAGTDGTLEQLYNDCVNGVITSSSVGGNVYLVNNTAERYFGDISGEFEISTPIYQFGSFGGLGGFIIGDLTELGMESGIKLATIGFSIPNNNIVIQQGFEFENENGIILPNSVTSIGEYAFGEWSSYNQPLVIPNSVTSIGAGAFYGWLSNNQPLVIPDSVTMIDGSAFYRWLSNKHPLVIPDSVTSIYGYAFSNWESNNQPLVIPDSVTIIGEDAFYDWLSNNHPLVIPDSVTSIGGNAFNGWRANNQPLVIPENVTSIGEYAFYYWTSVPYVEIKAITPPSLASSTAFSQQNNTPIYVPDASVNDYKTATNWNYWSDRIFPISEKP